MQRRFQVPPISFESGVMSRAPLARPMEPPPLPMPQVQPQVPPQVQTQAQPQAERPTGDRPRGDLSWKGFIDFLKRLPHFGTLRDDCALPTRNQQVWEWFGVGDGNPGRVRSQDDSSLIPPHVHQRREGLRGIPMPACGARGTQALLDFGRRPLGPPRGPRKEALSDAFLPQGTLGNVVPLDCHEVRPRPDLGAHMVERTFSLALGSPRKHCTSGSGGSKDPLNTDGLQNPSVAHAPKGTESTSVSSDAKGSALADACHDTSTAPAPVHSPAWCAPLMPTAPIALKDSHEVNKSSSLSQAPPCPIPA